MITRGSQQDLQLNPGLYSIDLNLDSNPNEEEDQGQFNASDWTYEYYCRIEGVGDFPRLLNG